jgi:histidine triad (HIT) family protein
MKDCIFCKIIEGKIPSAKIYDDENVISFLDIAPSNKGHALVVSKKHYATAIEADDETLSQMIIVAKKIAKAQSQALGNKGYNILLNNDKSAGQLVPHIHAHIIPRFDGDGHNFNWQHKTYGNGEMEEYKNKLMKFL